MDFEGSHVGMPRLRHEPIPVAAVYWELSWNARAHEHYRLWLLPVLLVWKDGRVVWSEDSVLGGAPYYAGRADRDRVQKLVDDLEACGAFSSPFRFWSRYSHHVSHLDLAIADGSRRLHLGADGHPPDLSIPVYDGERDGQFGQVWSDLYSALMSLRPDEGHVVGELEFELEWLP